MRKIVLRLRTVVFATLHGACAAVPIRVVLRGIGFGRHFNERVIVSENPYASSAEVKPVAIRRLRLGKLFWSGAVVSLVSVVWFYFLLRHYEMLKSQLSDPEAVIKPAEIARQFGDIAVPMAVAFLTGIVGLAVLVIGLFRTRGRYQ